jgi:hypothetical protein
MEQGSDNQEELKIIVEKMCLEWREDRREMR